MKITVVADKSGRLLGFAHDFLGNTRPRDHETAIAQNEHEGEQSVHVVELPPDLLLLMGDDKFDDEVFRHVVVKKGKKVALERR